ncbi:MAG: restriction endonuclease [Candidatus Promineifilaceae bacterium]|nr:restriction endonuclease [Anaerolineaceae bacterium]
MVVRTEWRLRQQSPQVHSQPRPAVALNSRWIIGLLTAVYLFWLLIRAVSQPAWLAELPDVVAEFLRLVEVGWLATLAVVWGVVWWQGRQADLRPLPSLSLEQLYNLQPAEFEQYVAQLFRQKKYKVSLRGRSGDLGVDLMLTRQGGKRAIVQCKRYRNTIGPDIVRELYGTLIHEGVSHAFLVTTADISDSAREWAQGKPMTLIDGPTLVEIARSLQIAPTKPKSA